jgi:phage tail-like protein
MNKEFTTRVLTREDWKTIDHPDLVFDKENSQALTLKEGKTSGSFMTQTPLDSGMIKCKWHRIRLAVQFPAESSLTVSFYTSDTIETLSIESTQWTEPIVIKGGMIPDALIQAPQGQYIYLRIDFQQTIAAKTLKQTAEGNHILLSTVMIDCPRQSYLQYLPAQFQQQNRDFQENYLALFQSIMADKEELISSLPMYIDPEATPWEFIPWLAQWLSLDLYELLGNRNRDFILSAMEIYKSKGTPDSIVQLLELLTNKKCLLKEYMNNIFHTWDGENLQKNGAMFQGVGYSIPVSRTVDTNDGKVLGEMRSFKDETHYVTDTSIDGRYSANTIGLFIFLSMAEDEEFVIRERELHRIIDSFLPAFVRAEISIVEEIIESYNPGTVITDYWDRLHTNNLETVGLPEGDYIDGSDLETLYSHRAEVMSKTGSPDHQTPSLTDRAAPDLLFTWSSYSQGLTNHLKSNTYAGVREHILKDHWLWSFSPDRKGETNKDKLRSIFPIQENNIHKKSKI